VSKSRIGRICLQWLGALISFVGVSVAVAVAQPPEPSLRVAGYSSPSSVDVEIRNVSTLPLPIWKDTNSWGAARWRILILRTGHLVTCYQSPNLVFTRNSPVYIEVPAQSSRKQVLDLRAGHWLGNEKDCGSFKTGDTVIVVYDVPPSREAEDFGVWFGVSATVGTFP
jgi:hypothetical protein